ncbi:MAG: mannitol dehydrogenase family protein [Rhizobiaceae bacterium]
MVIKLSQSALDQLPNDISTPGYDRSALTPGIVHIGVGNFHRAHQAIYLDRLFSLGGNHDWALIGAGVRPLDIALRADLERQDWLTTVVELDPDGLTARVCGSMIDYTEIDPSMLIDTLTRPEIRIVSLTVTEGGYFVDAKTGGFDAKQPEILADVASPDAPQTVFGILCAALRKRHDAGVDLFTVMSCDNLPENGHVAREATCGLATAIDPDFGSWVKANVAFPNGMVDCITPATSDRERALVQEKFGIEDARPVVCEPFRQWVLEDEFPQGRPALEKVGVEFVEDVAPYELMKLRILNGGHAAIAYPSALLGHHFVHDAMANPLIRGWLAKLAKTEIIPTVPEIPGIDFQNYLVTVTERFSNPAIGDTIPRLCLDGSNRQPKFILPAIADRLETGGSIDGLALEVALWCRYCAGLDETGNAIELDDENADALHRTAKQTSNEPSAFLSIHSIFGDLNENEIFVGAFSTAISSLWRNGTRKTLSDYIAACIRS